jgi:catechol 2,3-dioxygenase-like lactoylglutathione lyase family enzyme
MPDSANRRTDVLGIHSLDHFSLTVPDLAQAQKFYTTFGLDVRNGPAGFDLYTSGHPHRWGTFREGKQKKLNHLTFGAFADDMPAFRKRLESRGIELLAPPPGSDGAGLWFRDFDGALVEIRAAEKSSPNAKATVNNVTAPPGVAAMPLRDASPFIRPRRMSHVLVFTSDVALAVEFYMGALGLGLSDTAGDGIAFLHGLHGSDHHLIAFAKSDSTGFHHCSWDVESFNDVGQGAMQMADAGHVAGWGLGRHVLGSNYFHYVRDPWGSYCEYSHDIDYVPLGSTWKGGAHAPENGFYLWGPLPPEDFAVNFESPSNSLTRDLQLSEPV